jgi:hypothetical protein
MNVLSKPGFRAPLFCPMVLDSLRSEALEGRLHPPLLAQNPQGNLRSVREAAGTKRASHVLTPRVALFSWLKNV